MQQESTFNVYPVPLPPAYWLTSVLQEPPPQRHLLLTSFAFVIDSGLCHMVAKPILFGHTNNTRGLCEVLACCA